MSEVLRMPKLIRACDLLLLAFLLLWSTESLAQFELVGTHPDAINQPAASTGRELRRLVAYQGRLYIAYGDEDYNNNVGTGPIRVTPYDPSSGTFVYEWTQESEAIDNYVEINNRLYIPNVDFHHPTSDFSTKNSFDVFIPAQGWQKGYTTTDYVHAYDVTTLNGADLYIVGGYGSSGRSAKVDKSVNGGASWQNVFEEEPNGNYARYYFAGVYQGKLYVQADVFGSLHANSKVYDGVSWSNGPRLNSATAFGQHTAEFGGYMLYRGDSSLMKFNGTTSATARGMYKDFTIVGNTLYYLQSNGEIYSTEDLNTWQFFRNAPSDASSIGVLDNYLYIGTKQAELYRALVVTVSPPSAPKNLRIEG